jgi:5-methyltetrahydropteroyltriglutamate--homocysteine methyltransferase
MSGMMWNEFYDSDDDLLMDLCDIMNEEYKNVADAGCPLIQIEEPLIHSVALSGDAADKRLQFLVEAFNREVRGLDAEIWAHTCWGNPSQQRMGWDPPSYEKSLSYLLELEADVLTMECASSDGRDLPLLANVETDKKIAIGVVSHTNTVVEPASVVADRVRRALKYVPPDRLILSTDCGFGREGLSRRIAFYKTVALVQGVNIVRKELGLPEARIRAEDPRFAFGQLSEQEPVSSLLPWQESNQGELEATK